VLWEKVLKKCEKIEMTGHETKVNYSFVKGYSPLPVTIKK